jgi:hypothetical protein
MRSLRYNGISLENTSNELAVHAQGLYDRSLAHPSATANLPGLVVAVPERLSLGSGVIRAEGKGTPTLPSRRSITDSRQASISRSGPC